ncbi:MAG: GDYXXLXY domain-containing protein [Planctomycetota bacterium]|nr:GDYXXLXY domain-containing protein [Planctomycetota bacterium]
MPARNIYTRLYGTPVVLRVAPVDPYSIMSGYYVTLTYEIDFMSLRPWADRSAPLPGSPTTAPDEFRRFEDIPEGATVYVCLAEKGGVWSATAVRRTPPPSGLFIRGVMGYSAIEYGIERYYIPEGARIEISDGLGRNARDPRVHVKIDSAGYAVIDYLTIQDRVYRY